MVQPLVLLLPGTTCNKETTCGQGRRWVVVLPLAMVAMAAMTSLVSQCFHRYVVLNWCFLIASNV